MRRLTTSSSFRILGATVALTASLALAACGSSTPTTAATSPGASSTTTSASGAVSVTTMAAAATTTKAASSASGKVAACSLVTKAEAEAAIGVTVDPGVQSPNGTSCEYFPVDPVSAGATTGVTIQTADAAAFAKAKGSGPALKATITPVSGIGDDAFLIVLLSQQLQVLKGSNSVVITVGKKGASDSDVASLEKSLATKIVPRLP